MSWKATQASDSVLTGKEENMRGRSWSHRFIPGHEEISVMCQQRLSSIIRDEGETGL